MKQTKQLFFILLLLPIACSQKQHENDFDFRYITDLEVVSPKAVKVSVDNFAKRITLLFERDKDLSKVTLKLTLANGVEMVDPATATATYDLSDKSEILLRKKGETITFKLLVRYQSAPLTINASDWEKKEDFGALPEYVSVYRYKKNLPGKSLKVFIAVAETTGGKARFALLGEKKGSKTPKQYYQEHFHPVAVMNGGYFWSNNSLGLMIREGVTLSHAQPVVNREYNGVQTPYYPTLGAFGLESDGSFTAQWVYESDNTLYAYPAPSPNKAGDTPQPKPSKSFPEGGVIWQPKEAIGAGPLLIKNGTYKNLWENELFDEASGVGPTYNHPRSAIAYHPNGYLVFFVCEGRNKTPNTPGLSLKEVADLLLSLGCTEAINLDGGGSSCMLINGKETIIPSDKNGQRAVTNAVAIY